MVLTWNLLFLQDGHKNGGDSGSEYIKLKVLGQVCKPTQLCNCTCTNVKCGKLQCVLH